MARSTTVLGPYTGTRNFISQGGTDYYTYHYYPNTGGSVLGLGVLTWGTDGWPVSNPK